MKVSGPAGNISIHLLLLAAGYGIMMMLMPGESAAPPAPDIREPSPRFISKRRASERQMAGKRDFEAAYREIAATPMGVAEREEMMERLIEEWDMRDRAGLVKFIESKQVWNHCFMTAIYRWDENQEACRGFAGRMGWAKPSGFDVSMSLEGVAPVVTTTDRSNPAADPTAPEDAMKTVENLLNEGRLDEFSRLVASMEESELSELSRDLRFILMDGILDDRLMDIIDRLPHEIGESILSGMFRSGDEDMTVASERAARRDLIDRLIEGGFQSGCISAIETLFSQAASEPPGSAANEVVKWMMRWPSGDEMLPMSEEVFRVWSRDEELDRIAAHLLDLPPGGSKDKVLFLAARYFWGGRLEDESQNSAFNRLKAGILDPAYRRELDEMDEPESGDPFEDRFEHPFAEPSE